MNPATAFGKSLSNYRRIAIWPALLTAGLSACMGTHLDKYRNSKNSPTTANNSPQDPPSRGEDGDEVVGPGGPLAKNRIRVPMPKTQEAQPARAVRHGVAATPTLQAPRATIYAVDKQSYHFAIRDTDVWEAALTVLLRNYNLTIVDRGAGILATEWDSFYLDRAVYRNKLSLRMARTTGGGVDLTLHNSVERLRDAAQAAGTVGAVWLPSPDPGNEVTRIVQNMALLLNQPPPVVPPNATPVAKSEPSLESVRR